MNRQNKISAGVEGQDKLEINGDIFFSFFNQDSVIRILPSQRQNLLRYLLSLQH